MIILWFVIIGVIVYFITSGNLNLNAFQRKSPYDHLNERLAKGEISIDEYRELKFALKENK